MAFPVYDVKNSSTLPVHVSDSPTCHTCGKLDLLEGAVAPKERRDQYCDCVKWSSMDQCVALACRNAKQLIGDAELLFKNGRLETAAAFVTFAKEEEGKAVMAAQWWFQKKNLTHDEYIEAFRGRDSHLKKLVEATRIHYTQSMPDVLREVNAKYELDKRERALYTDYDFGLRRWSLPTFELIAQVDPESAEEGEKIAARFDSIIIKDEIRSIRIKADWFLEQFQKKKNESIPGAVVALPDREPTLWPVPRKFTVSFLQDMETALIDERDQLRNMIADTRFAKWPSFFPAASVEFYRTRIHEEKSQENKRILTKLLVDELRRGTFGDCLTVLHSKERKFEYQGAMRLMDEFANRFGVPFCRERRYPPVVKRTINKINKKRSKRPFDVVQEWRDALRECSSAVRTDNPSHEGLRMYWKLERAFQNLFMYSDWSLSL